MLLRINKKRTPGPNGAIVWNAKCAKTNRLVGTFIYQDRKLKVHLEKGIRQDVARRMFEKEFPTLHKDYM